MGIRWNLIAISLSVFCLGCATEYARSSEAAKPLTIETGLKELIQGGFEGSVAGFPKKIEAWIGPAGESLLSPEPYFSTDCFRDVAPNFQIRSFQMANSSKLLAKEKKGYEPVFKAFRQKTLNGPHFLSITNYQKGDIEDLEVLYDSQYVKSKVEWVPYYLFYWNHFKLGRVNRRGVFIRPRFSREMTLEEQMDKLGIKAGEPVWVHPKIGMIYLVLDPDPKHAVFFLVTSPRLGPPRIDAVMDKYAGQIAALQNFAPYSEIEQAAFSLINSGKNADCIHFFEPYLACHVLNKAIQERIGTFAKRVRTESQNLPSVKAAFEALNEVKNENLWPTMLVNAQKAGYSQGLLTELQKRTLTKHAKRYLSLLNQWIKEAQSQNRFGTAAGFILQKQALLGRKFHDGTRLVEKKAVHNLDKDGALAKEGTELQQTLRRAARQFPVIQIRDFGKVASSWDRMEGTPGDTFAKLKCQFRLWSLDERLKNGSPLWIVEIPKIRIKESSITEKRSSRMQDVAYSVKTPEYVKHLQKMSVLEKKVRLAYEAIPVQTFTTTRDEWVQVKYVSGNRSLGTTWNVRPVSTTTTGRNFASPEAGNHRRLVDELYQLSRKAPKIKYETKYTKLMVNFQVWKQPKQNWNLKIYSDGERLLEYPIETMKTHLRSKHAGSRQYGIQPVNEWTSKARMLEILKNATQSNLRAQVRLDSSLLVFKALNQYIKKVCKKSNPMQQLTEAAWLRFWFGQKLSELDKQLLPMEALTQLQKDQRALALESVAASLRSREDVAASKWPLNSKNLDRSRSQPPYTLRPGKFEGVTLHVETSARTINIALLMIKDFQREGAILTRFKVTPTSFRSSDKLEVDVNVGGDQETRRRYGSILKRNGAVLVFGKVNRISFKACDQCKADKDLKGLDGKALPRTHQTVIHIY